MAPLSPIKRGQRAHGRVQKRLQLSGAPRQATWISHIFKRLRDLAPAIEWLITVLACDMSLWTDEVWVVDSTPVECGRSRETARRSDLAGDADYT